MQDTKPLKRVLSSFPPVNVGDLVAMRSRSQSGDYKKCSKSVTRRLGWRGDGYKVFVELVVKKGDKIRLE